MPKVTLPDGSSRDYSQAISIFDVASDIGPGLAKAALAGKVDGELVDTSFIIKKDAELAIVTSKSDEALELIRHDAAHVMAQAVQELFPGTQVTIGPAIEDGFYYDFARQEPFSLDDLEKIESRMEDIVSRNLLIEREVWERDEAKRVFAEIGEKYKVEIIEDIIPEGEEVSVYRQGDWLDVCRGPHLPSTGKLPKAFKLMKLAGAYWRGNSDNEMLQRIYGTAWRDKKELKSHIQESIINRFVSIQEYIDKQNSSCVTNIGKNSENKLEPLLNQCFPDAEIENTSGKTGQGDFIIRRNSSSRGIATKVMVENKCYSCLLYTSPSPRDS